VLEALVGDERDESGEDAETPYRRRYLACAFWDRISERTGAALAVTWSMNSSASRCAPGAKPPVGGVGLAVGASGMALRCVLPQLALWGFLVVTSWVCLTIHWACI
jgi:hypothetical protein